MTPSGSAVLSVPGLPAPEPVAGCWLGSPGVELHTHRKFLLDSSTNSCMPSCCRWWHHIDSLLARRRGSSPWIFSFELLHMLWPSSFHEVGPHTRLHC
jgi:hypothetical protein